MSVINIDFGVGGEFSFLFTIFEPANYFIREKSVVRGKG